MLRQSYRKTHSIVRKCRRAWRSTALSADTYLSGVGLVLNHSLVGPFGLFVGALVLTSACGDGEMSEVPGEARLGPEASDDGEMCSSGICIDAPANGSPPPPPTGTPYGHVVPSDVGNTIGVGVVAPVPTTPYTGPTTVSTNGTLIENVVISGEQIFITGDNVTLRNVVIDVNDWNGITFAGANNARLEYSKIHNSRYGKAIKLEGGIGIHIENNEISGGQDFFFFTYDLDEVYIENNYMHHVVGDEDAHCDGFQWFESFDNQNFYIRGNYITANNPEIGMTDLLVVTDPTANVLFENNYLGLFGFYTLRWCAWCSGDFTIQNNVYAQEFKTAFTEPGYPTHAIDSDHPTAGGVYRCNRYEDGDFIEQTYVRGVTHDTTGCPSYP